MLSAHTEIYVSTLAVSMRRSEDHMFDATRHLCEIVGEGSIIICLNRRGNRARAVWRTNNGPMLVDRGLESGTFSLDAFPGVSERHSAQSEIDPSEMRFDDLVRVDTRPSIQAEVKKVLAANRQRPDELVRVEIVNAVLQAALSDEEEPGKN